MERESSQARVRRTGTMDRERVGGMASEGREREWAEEQVTEGCESEALMRKLRAL